ncbi:MAG: sulfotransferase [Parvularculaceae bacterium]|nr:sulfotransferase [Parvularculaceae bacterium]
MSDGKTPFDHGIAAAQAGDFARATAIARTMFVRDPNDVGALQIAGFTAYRQGRNVEALRAFIRANQIEPGRPQLLYWLGVLYKERGDYGQAERAFAEATERDPGNGDALCHLAEVRYLNDQRVLARATFEKALAAEPRSATVLARAARFFETTHEMGRARSLAADAMRLDPENAVARLAALEIDLRDRRYEAVIAAAAPLLTAFPGSNRRIEARLHHILATAHDRLGDFGPAFGHYSEANRLLAMLDLDHARGTPSPLQTEHLDRMIRFLQGQDPAFWPRDGALEGRAPVFLMGFVRSGTTWLDQILSSHPRIAVMEEEDNFVDAWRRFSLADEGLSLLPEQTAAEINALRASYWARAKKALGRRDDRDMIVDKLPLNTAQLALIWRLFPEAKIIFVLRDPRDAVLSAFQQHFQVNPGMAHFLDIKSAAEFYDRVMTIGDLVRGGAQLNIHDVRYENIVADFDGEIGRILDFLGVGWDDAVRNYRETALARAVRTPSAKQVIEKPYDTSIGKWRHYRDGMAPALAILAPWVKRFGYAPD